MAISIAPVYPSACGVLARLRLTCGLLASPLCQLSGHSPSLREVSIERRPFTSAARRGCAAAAPSPPQAGEAVPGRVDRTRHATSARPPPGRTTDSRGGGVPSRRRSISGRRVSFYPPVPNNPLGFSLWDAGDAVFLPVLKQLFPPSSHPFDSFYFLSVPASPNP